METALDRILSRPASSATYSSLLAALARIGPSEVQVKKTSLHIASSRAFLGVHRAHGACW